MTDKPTCRVCGVVLTSDNWYPSQHKGKSHICKKCSIEKSRLYKEANPEKAKAYTLSWTKANPDKAKENWTKTHRKNGALPMDENKECSSYFGVYIVEGVLKQLFKNVVRMPYGNPGYDFLCSQDKKIDGKGSCLHKDGRWSFNIRHNTIADYFCCVAFDNRTDLNPMHIWLLPGDKFNHLVSVSICPNTIHKWDEYKQDTNKVIACCDIIKGD